MKARELIEIVGKALIRVEVWRVQARVHDGKNAKRLEELVQTIWDNREGLRYEHDARAVLHCLRDELRD